MSKVLPYVLFLIIGIGLFFLLRKRVSSRLGKGLLSLIIIFPVGVYFAINPIYEGDFSNNVVTMDAKSSFEFAKNELTVVAIPHCPYCEGSIDHLNKIIERTEVTKVNFVVIADNNEAMTNYRALANKKIEFMAVANYERFADVAEGRFPTFVYRDGSKLNVWHGDEFGVKAMDWLEDQFNG